MQQRARTGEMEQAWARLCADHRADETACVKKLLADGDGGDGGDGERHRTAELARKLVLQVRDDSAGHGGVDAFLHEYGLSTDEGVVLMCLAEALLRVPDAATADQLIRDKLAAADWQSHLGHSDSLLVNAATWALLLTGRMVAPAGFTALSAQRMVTALAGRIGEPLVRRAVTRAMRILGRQFVMGRTIAEALAHARADEADGRRHSYDMLGEAALTADDAARYLDAYHAAIAAIGAGNGGGDVKNGDSNVEDGDVDPVLRNSGISVKLSALHPRYEPAQEARVLAELTPRLLGLAVAARDFNIGLTVDAEEAARLLPSLAVLEQLSAHPALRGWNGLGFAVQAYQKRAPAVLRYLTALARRDRRRFALRLVKGAYWDTEIKRAQEDGVDGYPVFTRKSHTDVSYLHCARYLLCNRKEFFPQFATHNAHTVARVTVMAEAGRNPGYEFQRLHGMGEALYKNLRGKLCRVYAPVGKHEDLLAYLVRRLLENGANTSFVNRIVDRTSPVEEIIADPAQKTLSAQCTPHPRIPQPRDLFRPERANSAGVDLDDPAAAAPLLAAIAEHAAAQRTAAPLTTAKVHGRPARDCYAPLNSKRAIGRVTDAAPADCEPALAAAAEAAEAWEAQSADRRAACLDRAADLLEENRAELMALLGVEAGRTVADALSEVREAVDFCRYYAACGRRLFGGGGDLPGPTGESNRLQLHGRGVFACISPWNFPLAIFTGQVGAALMAGNAVVAKPAEQAPLVAHFATQLLHRAGVPREVLHLLPGGGDVGAALVADRRTDGIAFTGGTATADAIRRSLAGRGGRFVPLIAESGGLNAMIADSSALPEQLVSDVVTSAFQSAGQRCSALRVLFVQEDVAERVLQLLRGAMAELHVGDPALLHTDVGPVINAAAVAALEEHAAKMEHAGRLIFRCELSGECGDGFFFAPRAYQVDGIAELHKEIFGPILHVATWRAGELDKVVDAINACGYGLTLGVHSRINAVAEQIAARAKVGNLYVNRNQIGAVVGAQPFGGEGLSGTGPKAGGPNYLRAFAVERSVCINTTAQGGNAGLMSLE